MLRGEKSRYRATSDFMVDWEGAYEAGRHRAEEADADPAERLLAKVVDINRRVGGRDDRGRDGPRRRR